MTDHVVIFKVALSGRKSIWRKIAIKGSQTLDDLHGMIFDAYDRYDEHLYSFFFPRAKGKMDLRKIYRESVEYTSPHAMEDGGDLGQKDAAATRIGGLGLKKGQVFYYLFDFGDEWWHDITVEETEAQVEKGKYPRVIDEKGKSPPQYPGEDEED